MSLEVRGISAHKTKTKRSLYAPGELLVTFNSKESYFLYHPKSNVPNCTRSLQQFGKHFVIFLELDLCGSLGSVFIPVEKIGLLEL